MLINPANRVYVIPAELRRSAVISQQQPVLTPGYSVSVRRLADIQSEWDETADSEVGNNDQ